MKILKIRGFLTLMTAIAGLFTFAGCAALNPPVAEIKPHETKVHGDVLEDEYYWLRNRENPEVIEYLKAENRYTEKVMKDTRELVKSIYGEIMNRVKQDDTTVPVRIDDYYYYTRTEKGKQYPIYCRKKDSLDAEEKVILDVNELAGGRDYTDVVDYAVSPGHRVLAYALDRKGDERYSIYFKDLTADEMLPDLLQNADGSMEWAGDGKTLFYTVQNDMGLPFKVFRHVLGDDQADDEMVYHEKDEEYYLYLDKSRSREYIFIISDSDFTTETRFLYADDPFGEPQIIHPRQQGMEYYVGHRGEDFLILTNEDAVNFKLMSAPVVKPAREYWTEFIPHRKEVLLDDFDCFESFLVLHEWKGGLQRIRIIDMRDNTEHYVDFDEPAYSVLGGSNPDYGSSILRFEYTSMVTPFSVYDYHMEKKEKKLLKVQEIPGGYGKDDYVTERIFAPADDGTAIPVTLVYPAGLEKDGLNPLLLEGYGAYGSITFPMFSVSRLSLLDRGFVYALAHVRGGGELGRRWYEEGKLLNKKNTFSDFIDCAEYLIEKGYTSKEKLGIYGGSAGGLLIGAVVNMRPDLFRAAVADVPFVDVINTMLDETIPLTVYEYDEWGNPADEEYYGYMLSYSPYDNVKEQEYPHLLVEAGLHDPRVGYWEPAKWVARLRAKKTGDNMLLLRTDMGSGHGGPSGIYDFYRAVAFQGAFYVKALDVQKF